MKTLATAPAAEPQAARTATAEEDSLYSLVTRRLMPVLLTAFCIAYLDRINVGLAKLQMASDLGFSDAVYGFGAGIFYLAYAIFEVPSNLIMTIVTMTAASMCVFAVAPLLWAQPTALLSGGAAAAGIAMISSLGNLAGLFSPSLFGYLTVRTHSTSAGMFLLAGFMVLGGLLALVTPARLVNR